MHTATAIAHPNIAFIKYWGNTDPDLRLPTNGSLSMNLAGLETRTTVTFQPDLPSDSLILGGNHIKGPALQRVSALLDRVRNQANLNLSAAVVSGNNFPTGAGIASSASAFAALALAASAAAQLPLTEAELSALARTGSGSACRSIPSGFVEWLPGHDHISSHAVSIAPPEHWALVDLVAIVSTGHKATGSTQGHSAAPTSPLQNARIADTPRRLDLCRAAVLNCDFEALADVIEHDALQMHAVMMTSQPPLIYWQPATLAVMQAVQTWRANGLPVAFTIDAGANVHVICAASAADKITESLSELPGVVNVLPALPGGPAHLVA